MANLPTGTITFLFTDIEGSTRLVQELGSRWAELLEEHHRVLTDAFENHAGIVFGTEGDALFVAFDNASEALAAAIDGQRALDASDLGIKVRMGLHTGEAIVRNDDYVGIAVHTAARISSAANGGQVLCSATTRQLAGEPPSDCRYVDLGDHRLKDIVGTVAIVAVRRDEEGDEPAEVRSLSALPNNLPLHLTSFIGRQAEQAKVVERLAQARLVTLLGAGGAGKTRLALEVAAARLGDEPDGCWMVDLAPVTDPSLIARAFAEVLGLRPSDSSDDLAIVCERVANQRLLFVVDNCEHLSDDVAEVIDRILRSAPEVRILATSREALGADGESVVRVPSLTLPSSDSDVAASDAVALFCDRARQAVDSFDPSAEDLAAIADICRRLDGMPLAIELAAARVRHLNVAEISQRLDDRFKLLTGGVKTGLRRQQTLRATVDWSYELLTEEQRWMLRHLSAFVGGFTLHAAEAMAESAPDPIDALDVIAELVDRSLVISETISGTSRYRLLETIREYGRELLAEQGEAAAAWSAHLRWFTEVGYRSIDGVTGKNDSDWTVAIGLDLENIRQALSWSVESGDRNDLRCGARLAAYLYRFFWMNLLAHEGVRWLTAVRAAGFDPETELDGEDLAIFLVAEGSTHISNTTTPSADAYEAIVEKVRSIGLDRWTGEVLNDSVLASRFRGDPTDDWDTRLEEALDLREAGGDHYGVYETLGVWGQLAHARGDHALVCDLADRQIAVAEAHLSPARTAQARSNRDALVSDSAPIDVRIELGEPFLANSATGSATWMRVGFYLAELHLMRADVEACERLVDEVGREVAGTSEPEPVHRLAAMRAMISLARGEAITAGAAVADLASSMAKPEGFDGAFTARIGAKVAQADRRWADAARLFERAARHLGDAMWSNEVAVERAMCFALAGDAQEARKMLPDGDAVFDSVDSRAVQGLVDHIEGRHDLAAKSLVEAITTATERGALLLAVHLLEAISWVAADTDPATAVALASHADAFRRERGLSLTADFEEHHRQAAAKIADALGPEAVAEAMSDPDLSLDAGVSLAASLIARS